MRLRIDSLIIDGADHGDSVSVSGVCLPLQADDAGFVADVMLETMNHVASRLNSGSRVNLERAASMVDSVGTSSRDTSTARPG